MTQSGTWLMTRVAVAVACGAVGTVRADLEIQPHAGSNLAAPHEDPGAGRELAGARRWRDADPRADGDRIIDRLVANPQVMEQLGVTREMVGRMRDDLREVQDRSDDLDNRVRQLSLEQAEQMKRFFQAKDAGTNALMNLAEELGRVRTEQAKLTIRRMMVIRKYLTPDQIRQARELVRDRMNKERDGRGGPNAKANPDKQEQRRERAAAAAQPAAPLTKPPEGW